MKEHFIKHRRCGTDVIVKSLVVWCPKCKRCVESMELSKRGPYSLVLPEDTQEIKD